VIGWPGEPRASLDCGGGVANGIIGEFSINASLIWPGENEDVGASGRVDDPGGRGVDPLEPVAGPVPNCMGVLCEDISAVPGVSE